ncbi:MAG: hypothetical protein JXR94_05305 [Candidatus Hydrogenedentes bacterium]|nr:hypothetical protein [Candidatus Hydrogenedentota bacterium]
MLYVALTILLAASPFSLLYDMTRPDYNDISLDVRPEYAEAMAAGRRGDRDAAYAAFSRLAEDSRLTLDQRTHCLFNKSRLESGSMRQNEAIATLRRMIEFRQDNIEICYQADLAAALLMAQSGGAHPGFEPTIEEMAAQFERVFSLYDPYREQTVSAHMEFADECIHASTQGAHNRHYAQIAGQHLREAKSLVDAIVANPALADEDTLAELDMLAMIVDDRLSSYARYMRETYPSRPESARGVALEDAADAAFRDLLGEPAHRDGGGQHAGAPKPASVAAAAPRTAPATIPARPPGPARAGVRPVADRAADVAAVFAAAVLSVLVSLAVLAIVLRRKPDEP